MKIQGESPFSEKDQAYMKKYLESHPDSRMAWYLLGKQYERAGENNKANYCFNQAGDIYKAFENGPLPAETAAEERSLRQQAFRHRQLVRQRRQLAIRSVLLLLLLSSLLIAIPGGEAAAPAFQKATEEVKPSEEVKEPAIVIPIIELVGKNSPDAVGNALKKAVKVASQNEQAQTNTLIIEQEQRERWLLWSRSPEPSMSIRPAATKGQAQVDNLKLPECECKPERDKANRYAKAWAAQAESTLIARSIVTAVIRSGAEPPPRLETLAKSYPRNRIAGVDSLAAPYYEEAVKQWNSSAKTTPSRSERLKLLWASKTKAGKQPFKEALRIVVDKSSHRLALISGDQIIRSYKVGLGGKRTPEGKFTISEKVVNPNGSATGAFGSRGMTLSNTLYAIHGTDEPDSIGANRSLGCVRMTRQDVEELYDLVPIGTEVQISKGVLPDVDVAPPSGEKYQVPLTPKQDNPNKIYKWLG
ncbi:L,D-transpeptidase [Paenibacillus sp. UMB4589-SE434]|uniref:L,D-transpeptidase n=1 Tax=Paenibacillus sp. UMB4589-SE434 TaxID=3046314 RepID=UPI0025514E77|nr:L,D-transpeptidase [Paenibacillus sp. UMB4589-SE434]MDK8182515.1 L,D-transpeptidase [Paenibacillus sp. UMB4589-SE434]